MDDLECTVHLSRLAVGSADQCCAAFFPPLRPMVARALRSRLFTDALVENPPVAPVVVFPEVT